MPGAPGILSSSLRLLIGLVAVSLAGCSAMDDIRNATVIGLFDDPVTLTDGYWEGEPYVVGGASRPTAGIIDDLSVAGDLDGDGNTETVAFLWSATGGSGTRNHVRKKRDGRQQSINRIDRRSSQAARSEDRGRAA